MTRTDRFELVVNELRNVGKQFVPNRLTEIMKELAIAAEEACGQHCSAHRIVLATKLHGLLRGAGRASDGEPGVPHPILQALTNRGDVG